MKIRAWLFISFWAATSISFLHLGFHAVEKTELQHSVPPVVMFLFKHCLAVSSCFSSSYALKFRAQPKHEVRSNFVLLVYVFFSFVFPRTIEGMLIWHLLKTMFAWLLYLLVKLKMFFAMILHFPALALHHTFRFLWKLLPAIGVIIIVLLIYYTPPSLIITIIYSIAGFAFLGSFTLVYEYILAYAVSWIFSRMDFIWIPFFTFLGICSAILVAVASIWSLYFLVYELILACKKNFSEVKTRAGILLLLEISLFFASVAKKRDFSPILVLSISHFISVSWAAATRFGDYTRVSGDPLSDGEGVEGAVQIAMKYIGMKMKELASRLEQNRMKKFIEFAVGTVGAILFQNFFRISSFHEVAAFLYLAVMWLANLVLLGFCGDFGVFNFLLGNVVVGCTVGQFGLRGATWIALAAALLLFALRLKLETVDMAYEEDQQIELSIFGEESLPLPHRLPI